MLFEVTKSYIDFCFYTENFYIMRYLMKIFVDIAIRKFTKGVK